MKPTQTRTISKFVFFTAKGKSNWGLFSPIALFVELSEIIFGFLERIQRAVRGMLVLHLPLGDLTTGATSIGTRHRLMKKQKKMFKKDLFFESFFFDPIERKFVPKVVKGKLWYNIASVLFVFFCVPFRKPFLWGGGEVGLLKKWSKGRSWSWFLMVNFLR